MEARSCVGLENVVGRFDPFQRTVESETNPDPLTVNVNDGPPVRTEAGDNVFNTGAGFTPDPLKLTCKMDVVLALTPRTVDLEPSVTGVNVTLTLHDAPAIR
jgi:hypothetical protein